MPRYRYWKIEKKERPWQLIDDSPEQREKAIENGAMFFTWAALSAPHEGNGRPEPVRYGNFPLDFDNANDPAQAWEQLGVPCFIVRSQFGYKINSMISLSQSEPSIPVLHEELDTNPWLFNCLNGTIDLKTGELLPHNSKDMITKLSPYNYDPKAACSAWRDHLDKVMGGDEELVAFLQRGFG